MALKHKKSSKYMSLPTPMLWYPFDLFLAIKIYEEKVHSNRLVDKNSDLNWIDSIAKVRKTIGFETSKMVFKE